jgi:hypothetical protein
LFFYPLARTDWQTFKTEVDHNRKLHTWVPNFLPIARLKVGRQQIKGGTDKSFEDERDSNALCPNPGDGREPSQDEIYFALKKR